MRLSIQAPVRQRTIPAHGSFTSLTELHRTPKLSGDDTSHNEKLILRVSWNRFRSTGIFGKHLLNVDICHVLGTPALVQTLGTCPFAPTFRQSDTSRTHEYLWYILAVAFPRLVCSLKNSDIQYHSVCRERSNTTVTGTRRQGPG